MIPPSDIAQQQAAIEAGLQGLAEHGQPVTHEQLALQAHAFSLVRNPLWEHLRNEALRSQPAMLTGYVGSGSPLNMALARMAVSTLIEYVEALAAAHQEPGE